MICPAGYYCPVGGKSRLKCPSSHFCPLGAVEPVRCKVLSVCPEGSIREFHLIGIFSLVILDFMLIIVTLSITVPRKWRLLAFLQWLGMRLQPRRLQKFDSTRHLIPLNLDLPQQTSDQSTQTAELSTTIKANLPVSEAGIDIGFRNIEYCSATSRRPIIEGVTGEVTRGTLLGIMGPSGAGKSEWALCEMYID